jgi:hypothetical protein
MNPDVEKIIDELEKAQAEIKRLRAENGNLREAAQLGVMLADWLISLVGAKRWNEVNSPDLVERIRAYRDGMIRMARLGERK